MKHINLSVSSEDVIAISFALSILPELELEDSDSQADINYHLCMSALEKLSNQQANFSANEYRVIYSSLLAVQMINRGEIKVDTETKKECSNYLFTINRLVSTFSEQFE